jgi:hypothetical protein
VSIYLCIAAFALSYLTGRRSLAGGLAAVFGVGYAYGIVRANLPETYSHFIFDASVLGLYAAQLFHRLGPSEEYKISQLRPWLELLIAWPLLLFLIPIQDPLIQFVGLRGSIFFLPFLLFGARLKSEERYYLALWIAGLNLLAFVFAAAEFSWGLEMFFPHNKMTELIYISKDLAGHSAYRIPSTFVNPHGYGSTMAVSLPLLAGALVREQKRDWHFYLLMSSLGASMLGILMSATRTHFAVAAILVIVATFSLRTRFGYALGWLILLCGVGWMISGEGRLQRFMELKDTGAVAERVSASVNMTFLEAAQKYPMGNGLGGGGTSVPYFLQDRLHDPVLIENEYARIMLEQGIAGLVFWVAFIFWVLTRSDARRQPSDWQLGQRLAWWVCACYFAMALIGTGMLTAVPMSCSLLLCAGWVVARQPETSPEPAPTAARLKTATQVHRVQYN